MMSRKTINFVSNDQHMQWTIEKIITDFFRRWHGSDPDHIQQLPPSGSNRQYFRICAGKQSFIAAFNPDARENKAFIGMSEHFHSLGLPVPRVLEEDPEAYVYLLTDLGDTTLFTLLPHDHRVKVFEKGIQDLYKKIISWLPVFQVSGAKGLDFSICYPRKAFDRHSMMWDLNYFKYYFLKISGIAFDEQLLEDSFEDFVNQLLREDSHYFMYRDFQSRNVMIVDGEPYFIDYQGGRHGPLQYDIASLLFDAKANIPFALRMELLDYYISRVSELTNINTLRFKERYYDFVLIRIMQALATYGFRGGVEKKPLFLQSMPYALRNLKWLADNNHLPAHNPYLTGIVEKIISTLPAVFPPEQKEGLTVTIKSFSYKNGIPADHSGNGGGFVLDCRILPNPGRINEFKSHTGLNPLVIKYLEDQPEVGEFIRNASNIVLNGIDNYIKRGFNHLSVYFGCTGGQHRSVYCAEKMAEIVRNKFPVNIDLHHEEKEHWP